MFLWWYMSESRCPATSPIPNWDFQDGKLWMGRSCYCRNRKGSSARNLYWVCDCNYHLGVPLTCLVRKLMWVGTISRVRSIHRLCRRRAAAETIPKEHTGYLFDLDSTEGDDDDNTEDRYSVDSYECGEHPTLGCSICLNSISQVTGRGLSSECPLRLSCTFVYKFFNQPFVWSKHPRIPCALRYDTSSKILYISVS